MTERIEKFTCADKKFIYFDVSNFKTKEEFLEFTDSAKSIIERYEHNSVYTITNIEGVRISTENKKVVINWVEHNKPYVVKGAIVGVDGMKRIFINSILALTGRKNLTFAATREHAIGMLIKER